MPTSTRSKRDQRMKNPRAFRLTERDLAVLQAIYEYRVLSTHQVQDLFFSSLAKTRTRLQLLYHHGFLERKFFGVYFEKMNTPILYMLDRRGAETLHDAGILTKGWSSKSKKMGLFFLHHTLEVNSVRIAVTKACQRTGFALVEWRSEADLKEGYDRVKIMTLEQPVAVIPDAYFCIRTGSSLTHFFLELDRSTETGNVFKRKLLAYQVYCGSVLAKKRFGTTKFRVLTVTKSAARLRNLKQLVERVEGKNRFWFTTLPAVTQDAVLNTLIWQVAGRSEPTTLLY